MQSAKFLSFERKEYFAPNVEILIFDINQDVIRVSGDAYDNDVDARDGGFIDGK